MLPEDKMPEAEVTLRLAIALIENDHVLGDVQTAIDGAQVKTGNTVHFPIVEFLNENGWQSSVQIGRWQEKYSNEKYRASIIVHSNAGEGDLVADLKIGRTKKQDTHKIFSLKIIVFYFSKVARVHSRLMTP